ncbi:thioredoxin family protein [Pontibacter sp. JH31]|uniref:Thioredoxin family protein n=1 Tax=Pontibacter aquaedesilientis TaxID=2766980 RepID=A0ABR7XHQ7_9BACT|nr:thioredoxin family protein [Pontibacter aquaedesilientis]MBD1397791.1 thioredoxin family protein [Pontibacter aquaedesilientis]
MPLASTALPLGTVAPNFALLDTVSDQLVSLEDVASTKATVIMFLCNHCPYVLHILDELVDTANEYKQRGVSFVGISANDAVSYPQDGPQQMRELAKEKKFPFPYLYDQTQQVARTYQAVCTPEFYVFDRNMRLAYHGQFDDARPKNETPVTGEDLRQALDTLLAGDQVRADQKPGIGCGIKWKTLPEEAG